MLVIDRSSAGAFQDTAHLARPQPPRCFLPGDGASWRQGSEQSTAFAPATMPARFEPLERAFDGLLDVLRPAVQTRRTGPIIAATQVEPELGGDPHLLAEGREGLADEIFVCEGSIDFSGIKEGDAAFDGGPKKRGHLLYIFGRAIGKTHSHAAQPRGPFNSSFVMMMARASLDCRFVNFGITAALSLVHVPKPRLKHHISGHH